jgi:hypothetical protein
MPKHTAIQASMTTIRRSIQHSGYSSLHYPIIKFIGQKGLEFAFPNIPGGADDNLENALELPARKIQVIESTLPKIYPLQEMWGDFLKKTGKYFSPHPQSTSIRYPGKMKDDQV